MLALVANKNEAEAGAAAGRPKAARGWTREGGPLKASCGRDKSSPPSWARPWSRRSRPFSRWRVGGASFFGRPGVAAPARRLLVAGLSLRRGARRAAQTAACRGPCAGNAARRTEPGKALHRAGVPACCSYSLAAGGGGRRSAEGGPSRKASPWPGGREGASLPCGGPDGHVQRKASRTSRGPPGPSPSREEALEGSSGIRCWKGPAGARTGGRGQQPGRSEEMTGQPRPDVLPGQGAAIGKTTLIKGGRWTCVSPAAKRLAVRWTPARSAWAPSKCHPSSQASVPAQRSIAGRRPTHRFTTVFFAEHDARIHLNP